MSQQLPNPQEAYAHLYNEIHAPVFFNKLASHGIEVMTEKEAEELLTLAAHLREVPLQKQAQDSRFSSAVNALTQAAGPSQFAKLAQDQSVKAAAADLMRNTDVYASVLSLKLAEQQ